MIKSKLLKILLPVVIVSMSTSVFATQASKVKMTKEQINEVVSKHIPDKSKLLLTTQNTDDGLETYEVYAINDTKSNVYKIELDAYTGDILEYELETDIDYSKAENKYYKYKAYTPKVTQKKAEELALKDWPGEPVIVSTNLEEEDDLWTYVVKFKTDTYFAEVCVDTEKEMVRKQDYKKIDSAYTNNINNSIEGNTGVTNNITNSDSVKIITPTDAINIAQKKVPNAVLKEIDIDNDDRKYELDFRQNRTEYEIEVSFDGKIIKFETDYDD